jgi:hypothetical protein
VDLMHKDGFLYLDCCEDVVCDTDMQLTNDVIYEVQVMQSPLLDGNGAWSYGYRDVYYRVSKARDDKATPNAVEVLENIVDIIRGFVHSVEMRRITDYSFEVRRYMWNTVSATVSGLRMVVDCGVDRGQSLAYSITRALQGDVQQLERRPYYHGAL